MSEFLTERLRGLCEYVPGEQPQDMEYIKLNTNESPFPPPRSVIEAAISGRGNQLQLYPRPDSENLLDAIARRYGLMRENVILGNGSDEILGFCFAAFFSDGKRVCFPDITYGFYRVFSQLYGADFKEIPLTDELKIDVSDYKNRGGVVLANPNAPTGLLLPVSEIEKILIQNPENVVIVDEAYIDFGGESCVPLIKKYKNLIVVMTFSKSRSLAGARVGFAMADSALISDLKRIKYSTNPYNVNSLSAGAATEALKNEAEYQRRSAVIVQNRMWLTKELSKLGFCCTDSRANFVFARCPGGDGRAFYEKLKSRGVLVRHFDSERISDRLRITVGTRDELAVLIEKLKEIIYETR